MLNIMPLGYQAMIATPHYLATQVGSRIMHQGGNAFDASVAISAALAVVYPHMTGIGGDAFFLMYDAASGTMHGLNGSGRSGNQITLEHYNGRKRIPERGIESAITVPGMVDAWWEVWSSFGKLSWSELFAPAIDYAENGFPISRNLAYWMMRDEQYLLASEALSAIYLPQGKLLKEGERLVQRALARSLALIAKQGRSAFYEGELMQELTAGIKQDGGLLNELDFQNHRSEWVQPISIAYRGSEVCQMPPNSQGFSMLMMLNMLENTDLGKVPRDSAQFYHLVAEVVKKSFRDRDRYLTDPEFSSIPLQHLLSKEYAKLLCEEIQRDWPAAAAHSSANMGQDTAYAAVVDADGNAVSFIQSLYYDFGSAYIPGDTGVLMQNRGSFFSLIESEPNVLKPGKRSFHTLMPGMVLRRGKPYILLGTQGGEGQPQTQLSVLTGLLDYGCTVQEALALPRWIYGRTWGEDSNTLKLEDRLAAGAVDQLRQWGHRVEVVEPWDSAMGQSQAIMINEEGLISGAADPRGDGLAIGW